MPCKIAVYLDLQDPEMYTGHCFRRSSATMLPNSGSNITNIKRHGGWKSTSVAEWYIEDSIANKKKIAENILQKPTSSKSLSIQPDDQSNSFNRTSVALQDSTIHCTDMGQTAILASQTTFQSVREQTLHLLGK